MQPRNRNLLLTLVLTGAGSLALSRWSVTGCAVPEAESIGARGSGAAQSTPPERTRLGRPADSTPGSRTLVDVPVAESTDTEAAAPVTRTLEGILVLPEGFPANAVAKAQLWTCDPSDIQVVHAKTTFLAGDPWRFERVPPGTWMLSVRATSGERTAWGTSRAIDLSRGVDPGRVEIRMQEFAVEGRITDTSGRPIPGFPVNCTGVKPLQPRDLEEWESHVERDSFGSAQEGVSALRIWDHERGGSSLIASEATWLEISTRTDSEGRFRIAMETAGPVTLRAPDPREEPAPGEARYLESSRNFNLTQTSPVATVDLKLVKGASVSGRLFLPGVPGASGVEVFLRKTAGGRWPQTATVDGEFRFDGLEEGQYLLHARGSDADGRAFCTYRWLEVTEAADVALDETMSPASSAVGRVVDEHGMGVSVKVEARVLADTGASPFSGCRATTDESGYFRLAGLYPSNYQIKISTREQLQFHEAEVSAPNSRVDLGVLVLEPPRTW